MEKDQKEESCSKTSVEVVSIEEDLREQVEEYRAKARRRKQRIAELKSENCRLREENEKLSSRSECVLCLKCGPLTFCSKSSVSKDETDPGISKRSAVVVARNPRKPRTDHTLEVMTAHPLGVDYVDPTIQRMLEHWVHHDGYMSRGGQFVCFPWFSKTHCTGSDDPLVFRCWACAEDGFAPVGVTDCSFLHSHYRNVHRNFFCALQDSEVARALQLGWIIQARDFGSD